VNERAVFRYFIVFMTQLQEQQLDFPLRIHVRADIHWLRLVPTRLTPEFDVETFGFEATSRRNAANAVETVLALALTTPPNGLSGLPQD